MVPISGLFETHLTVRRLDTSIDFYRDVVGLEMAYRWDDRRVAFFWIGGRGNSMLGLWEVGTAPISMHLHFAFRATIDDVLAAPDKLRAAGILPLGPASEPVNEPVVFGWMPALSIYFADPDGHLLEYLAMLPDPPRPEVGVVPYSRWRELLRTRN
jgi:lactoylglutathione lyase